MGKDRSGAGVSPAGSASVAPGRSNAGRPPGIGAEGPAGLPRRPGAGAGDPAAPSRPRPGSAGGPAGAPRRAGPRADGPSPDGPSPDGPSADGPEKALRPTARGPGDQDEVLRRVSAAVLAVTRELSVRDVLQVIVRSVRSLSGARYAAIGIPDDRGSFAEFVVDGISERQRKAIGPLPRQHGMLAVMLREGQPLRLADIRADPRFEGWPHAHPELADILGMPIKDGDQVLGFVFAANKTSGSGFTVRDEELLSLFAAHAAIALTNARLYERARQLSVLEERARLARDLHDAVSQKLFSIRVKARAASVLASRDRASGDPERAAAEMESVAALAGAAQAELRAVIDGLAPPEISEGGLAESLRRYALLAGRAHGVRVAFAADDLPPLGVDREAALYRVAQEALHNALRHSGAAEVRMTVCAAPRRVTLEVTDEGRGFVPELASGGLGLPSLRERAAGAGASLVIRSAPGNGTTVRLVMPVDRGHGATAGRPG